MRISIVQHDIKAGDVEATLAGIERLLLSQGHFIIKCIKALFVSE